MADLHARLLEEIERRERIATGFSVRSEIHHNDAVDLAYDALWDRYGSDVAAAWEEYARPLHPADALRRYAHYRRVLERHYAKDGVCNACSAYGRVGLQPWSREVAWPCVEVRDLADALGIEVSHDGQ